MWVTQFYLITTENCGNRKREKAEREKEEYPDRKNFANLLLKPIPRPGHVRSLRPSNVGVANEPPTLRNTPQENYWRKNNQRVTAFKRDILYRSSKRKEQSMAKMVECAKVDPSSGCTHVIRGNTEQEVLQKAAEHAKQHGI